MVQISSSHIKSKASCNPRTDSQYKWMESLSHTPCLRKYRIIRKDIWHRHLVFKCVHPYSCKHASEQTKILHTYICKGRRNVTWGQGQVWYTPVVTLGKLRQDNQQLHTTNLDCPVKPFLRKTSNKTTMPWTHACCCLRLKDDPSPCYHDRFH